MSPISIFILALSFFGIGFIGCTSQKEGAVTGNTVSPLLSRGKTIYQTQCIACHNTDPKKPGSLGPEVFGSSKELLEARILRGEYPTGYQPKRQTHLMTPLKHLKNDIDAIHAYLNEVQKGV